MKLPPLLEDLIETARPVTYCQSEDGHINGYIVGHPSSDSEITFLRDLGPWKKGQVIRNCLALDVDHLKIEERDRGFDVVQSYQFAVPFENHIA